MVIAHFELEKKKKILILFKYIAGSDHRPKMDAILQHPWDAADEQQAVSNDSPI